MSKPIRTIKVKTMDGKKTVVEALINTGSFYTIIRQDRVPSGAKVISYSKPEKLGTAKKSGQVRVVASAEMIIEIEGRPIKDAESFQITVQSFSVGSRIKIEVWRQGQPITVWATLAVQPGP